MTASAFAQSQTLETEPLSITTDRGTFDFQVEIADEPDERSIGLMNRAQMPPKSGMLFAFETPQVITMWMKNTFISLDMIFLSAEGEVKTIARQTTPHSTDFVTSRVDVTYVLELNGGMAALIGLKPGDRIAHRLFENSQ